MLSIPPQHGKSSLVTERYTVYRIWKNPALRVGIGSYNQDFANRFGRRTKKLALSAGIEITANERSAANEWENAQGGGIISVGVGSGITGRPIDLFVIDDPVKSREEAESLAYRNRVGEWYTDDIYTRLQENAPIILIMTRWNEDDLAGRIQNSIDAQNWTIINLPAEAEDNDPLGRAEGEPLCPERFSKEALLDKRNVLGSYGYAALYQGRPAPREGGMFKRGWFEIVSKIPASVRRIRRWDLAATKDGGDFTAGVKMAVADGIYYIEDVRRFQESAHGVKLNVKQTAMLDGRTVPIWMEQEPGSAGKAVIADYARLLDGYSFHGEPSTGSKELRAEPFAAQCEAGNVKLVEGRWNKTFLDELEIFPNGSHDDQVDAASGAYNKLVTARVIQTAVSGEREIIKQYVPR